MCREGMNVCSDTLVRLSIFVVLQGVGRRLYQLAVRVILGRKESDLCPSSRLQHPCGRLVAGIYCSTSKSPLTAPTLVNLLASDPSKCPRLRCNLPPLSLLWLSSSGPRFQLPPVIYLSISKNCNCYILGRTTYVQTWALEISNALVTLSNRCGFSLN